MAISRVGKELYEMLIKPYTKKQWNKYPKELDAEVFTRLPYREDRDDRCCHLCFSVLFCVQYVVSADILTIPGRTCPRMDTPRCLRICC